MGYSFLLGIIMAIKNKFNIIILDDASFEINCINIYKWRKNDEGIYGDPKSDNKNILAINKSEILLGHYYKNETIGTQ